MDSLSFTDAFKKAEPFVTIVMEDGKRFPMITEWDPSPNFHAEGKAFIFFPDADDPRKQKYEEIVLAEVAFVEKISSEQYGILQVIAEEQTMTVRLAQMQLQRYMDLLAFIHPLSQRRVGNG
jgi:hypothetical protein